MQRAGFKVTQGVGGAGVVGVLRNGRDPTCCCGNSMPLFLLEKAGLPYASQEATKPWRGHRLRSPGQGGSVESGGGQRRPQVDRHRLGRPKGSTTLVSLPTGA